MTQNFINNQPKWKLAVKSLLAAMIISLVFSSVSFAEGGGRYQEDPWSFGVMADTQWTNSDDPEEANPEYVSAAIARALETEFIDNNVKFVIQVGDLTDRAGDAGMQSRATAAQPLISEGIGFFPLRGNHETYGLMYGRDGLLNDEDEAVYDMNIPAFLAAFPQTQGDPAYTFGATNFSSPSDIIDDNPDLDILDGLSYGFDYGTENNNATFVIVDVEATSYYAVPPEPHPDYPELGIGFAYEFNAFGMFDVSYVVYQSEVDIQGITTIYESTSSGPVAIEEDKPITITAGEYFRIDSGGTPCTDFGTWELYYPIADNVYDRVTEWVSDGTEFRPGPQQEWISARLDKTTRGTEHAFVFSHRGLMGTNHADGLFGSNPGSKSSQQNPFYASLADNGVKYMISGHDHLHNRAIVKSPDGENEVQQIISMAGSTKFYGPNSIDHFTSYYGQVKDRETQISQELYNVGYYIYTVDGSRVNVDYYGDAVNNFQDNGNYPRGDDSVNGRLYLPDFDFVKKESFGYSTNGEQFMVAQNESYTIVEDTFEDGTTTARILSGTNESTSKDETPYDEDDEGNPINGPRAFTKVVNTGWVANPDSYGLKSDIFSIWGMSEIGDEGQTDTYVLSMSVDWKRMIHLGSGCIGIATYVKGEWVNAVDENFGGEKNFVVGPYSAEYELGTYGMDPDTKTAWAVLNYNADFAVAMDIEAVPGQKKNRNRNRGK